jgi:hypothetical protein
MVFQLATFSRRHFHFSWSNFQIKILQGGANSILRGTIVPAVLAAIPAELRGPEGAPGPAGVAGGLNRADLDAVLAPLFANTNARVAELAGAVANTNGRLEILSAQIANMGIRHRNQNRRENENYMPLCREIAQIPGGVAVGAFPAGDLIPPEYNSGARGNAQGLVALRNHYGVNFADWKNFFYFLQH